MTNTATSSPPTETSPLPGNDSNLEPSSTTAGNSHAPASTAEFSEELKRLTALGTLLVNMGAASEEKIFGVKDSAPMLAYRQNRMHELLVINRPQDDAAVHMFIWYKPWTWWSSGAQVSPIVVKRMLTEEGNAGEPRTTVPPQTTGSTQTEADVVAPPPPPDAVEPKAAPLKRKKGLPAVDMRALTDEEVDALTPAVRDERSKLLLSEKHIHGTLQGMEDTRYRYLVPSRDLKCETEVMNVVRCYTERNQAKAASLAAEGGRAPPGAAAASHNRPSGGGEKTVVRADLLACGPHVRRLKVCAESMVMQYSREGEAA
ncbi:conserved hypothetical protein [Leishmania major strain Friedlin]|uniref:Uncharacterized protein n=1 Tax=Leishmania major TaxID=5664 RepID=E9ACD9_LEIMA|nr:conserved hypothetical protein [Leishmania major strain Friedlin]CAG9567218.1 hypothetical_protein_-_conserved [Leishmania major strain Friedlin]CBZ11955.1 conserved hypothetical protein [Leishmania major strain Friedlin]|eukprot:XP_003721670.1 conserved hypothetical protein [Leishmania major strain Friedlin]